MDSGADIATHWRWLQATAMSVLAWAVGHLALRGFYTVEFFDDFISSSDTLSSESFADPKGFSWFTGCADLWHQGLWFFEATTSNKNWRWRSRQIRKIFRFHRGKNAATDYCLMRLYINQLNQVESLSMTWILPSFSFRQDAQGLTALAQALKAWKARDQSSEWEPLICSTRIWSHTNLLQVSFLYLF